MIQVQRNQYDTSAVESAWTGMRELGIKTRLECRPIPINYNKMGTFGHKCYKEHCLHFRVLS